MTQGCSLQAQVKETRARLGTVGTVVSAIGETDMGSKLLSFIHGFTPVDMISSFCLSEDESRVSLLCAAGTSAPQDHLARSISQMYAESFWQYDRALIDTSRTSEAALQIRRQLPEAIADARYRNLFARGRTRDRLSIIGRQGQVTISVNLYRSLESRAFGFGDTGGLEALASFLLPTLHKHYYMVSQQVTGRHAPLQILVQQFERLAPALSAREAHVCARIVIGQCEKDTAAMGLQLSTVVTYRKRAYFKLDVYSRRDLVRLFDEKVQSLGQADLSKVARH
jgi:LuxR family transcriptional regulator, activator of tox operons